MGIKEFHFIKKMILKYLQRKFNTWKIPFSFPLILSIQPGHLQLRLKIKKTKKKPNTKTKLKVGHKIFDTEQHVEYK